MSDDKEEEVKKPLFKAVKKKQGMKRKKVASDDEADQEEDAAERISAIVDIQKSRRRNPGVGNMPEIEEVEEEEEEETFGLLDKKFGGDGEGYQEGDKRDPHLEAYIQANLNPGGSKSPEPEEQIQEMTEEQKLYAMPDHLKPHQDRVKEVSEKMGWATGLAEVPISADQKIKNIEDTEEAKARHLTELAKKKKQIETEGQDPKFARAFGHRFKKYTTPAAEAVAGATDERVLAQYKKRFGNRR
eukprot:gene421-586_t